MQEVLTIPNENFSKQQELVFPYTTINKKLKLEDYSSLESFYKNYKAVNSYNNFNQATQIDFSQDKKYRTKYSYDGSGRKYKTEYLVYSLTTTGPWLPGGGIGIGIASSSSSLPNVVLPPPISVIEPYRVQSTIDYCGNIIYRDGELDKVLTQEGYVDRASDGSFQYHYYLRDHQGNNRVVITQNSKVEQVNHYYPFGALFGDSQDRSGQPYKFGGKELDRMFGLDLFDFHARSVDGPLGRTPTPDPRAENYYSISPYVYCMNNPIRYIDPDGMDVWSTDDPEEIQRFMDAMRSRPSRQKTESFNYKKWDNVTDKEIEEASESLFYDDEEMLFYMGNDPEISRFAFEDKKGYATIRATNYLEGGNISQVNIGFDLLAGGSTVKLVKSLGTEFFKLFVKSNVKKTVTIRSFEIAGFTRHGIHRVIERGTKSSHIVDALRNPLKISKIKIDPAGQASQRIIGRDCHVVINPTTRKIISTNPTSEKLLRKLTK